MDEETGSEKLGDLPKITQPVQGRAKTGQVDKMPKDMLLP